jgi:hypothetical protein
MLWTIGIFSGLFAFSNKDLLKGLNFLLCFAWLLHRCLKILRNKEFKNKKNTFLKCVNLLIIALSPD